MSKNIAFYISDRNMEHALRNIPIISTILKMESELQVFVKSGKDQIAYMKTCLRKEDNLRFYEMEMREQDPKAWEELAKTEEEFLKEEKIGLVLSDICPWVFLAADELRIKSLLLGNYTWADVDEDNEEMQEAYLECYELASKMYIYDLHHPAMMTYGVDYELISMINRPYNIEEIESLPEKYSYPLVFADIEGNFDVSGLPYHFLVVGKCGWNGDNVTYLSADRTDLQNYVAASQFVIARGSWNRIAEIVLSNRKAALIEDENIPMSSMMIETLEKREQCIRICKENLKDLGAVLSELELFSYSFEEEYHNNDYEIAKKILFSYPEKRRRTRS